MWHGKVDASSPDGKATSVHLKKGEPISILAKGWVRFGPGDTQWADPQSPIPPYGPEYESDTPTALVATIGKDTTTRYPIGNGVFNWPAPAEGQLVFLFADAPNEYGDNKGSFDVTVWRGKPVAWSGTLEATAEKGVPTGVTVSKGDVISVTVTGSAKASRTLGEFGPDGDPNNHYDKVLLPSANVGAVLMKIGNGTYTVVGSGLSGHSVKDDGAIVFLYNDVPGSFNDNSGSFEITLTA